MYLRDHSVSSKHMTLTFIIKEKMNEMLTYAQLPTWMALALTLNVGNHWKDVYLRRYFFDIKLSVATVSRSILQSVPSINIPIVVDQSAREKLHLCFQSIFTCHIILA